MARSIIPDKAWYVLTAQEHKLAQLVNWRALTCPSRILKHLVLISKCGALLGFFIAELTIHLHYTYGHAAFRTQVFLDSWDNELAVAKYDRNSTRDQPVGYLLLFVSSAVSRLASAFCQAFLISLLNKF